MPPRATASTSIRPFEREDLPQVVSLYEHVARSGSRTPPPGLAAYFERLFLDYPGADPDIPSLVHVGPGGKIAGFLGSSIRHFVFDGRPIRVAVSGQLVTEPEIRTQAAGVFLIREYMNGPQDLTVTDTASDTVRRIWERLGGETFHLACVGWVRVFRPWRFGASYLSRRRLPSVLGAARPLWSALDAATAALLGRVLRAGRPEGTSDEELSPAALTEGLAEVASDFAVRADYDEAFAEWLFRELEVVTERGTLVRRLVRSPDGKLRGWYIYYLVPGGIGQVLQVAGVGSGVEDVLDALFHDAQSRGAAGLQGRVEAHVLQPLSRRRCVFHAAGYLVLVHGRDPELVHALQSGRALLTRLDAEWWMGHHLQPFDERGSAADPGMPARKRAEPA